MLNRPSPDQVGRRRVVKWEVRNLRIVANIREGAARHSGGHAGDRGVGSQALV